MWEDFLLFIAVGLAAQMVDGAIGMAYGVISTSVLLSVGIPPATASAAVHTAETFTTGASGLAHWRLGNIDRGLIWRLAVPGMIGGAIGAYLLTAIPGEAIRPYVSGYLLLLGLFILWKAVNPRPVGAPPPSRVAPLGFAGGVLDSIGGGGWGPIVTSTLLGQGATPRYAIGSVNLAEFFVTLDHLGDLPPHHRPDPVAHHRRPGDRRRAGRAVRGAGDQAYAGQGADGAGRVRGRGAEHARVAEGAGLRAARWGQTPYVDLRSRKDPAMGSDPIIQTPRYRCCTSGAAASCGEVPVHTTRPRSMR